MATEPAAATPLSEAVGMKMEEILALKKAAEESLCSPMLELSRRHLHEASPATCGAIRNALTAPWLSAFSKAGQATAVLFSRDQPDAIATWEGVLTTLLANPVMLHDVAIWCLFFAALEGAAQFQLDDCQSPSEEGHLSGLLLGALKARCEQWRRIASTPLARSESSLSLQRIDLSILGGEQATGGDFGLILDFDDRSVRLAKAPATQIVPLIFQAKRYVRPYADVSQHHVRRGYQYQLLAQNSCASAYIFYESGRARIDHPVPPLVKPVRKVAAPFRTSVFSDSYDISSYLLNALTDGQFATGAASADEALRMLYARADRGQLAYLAVISSDDRAVDRYKTALRDLAPVLRAPPRDGDLS